jgi:hypothetical protein
MLEPFDDSCVECGGLGQIVSGAVARPNRTDLRSRLFLKCQCGAFVTCHAGTAISMGRPAGPITRHLRHKAHQALDARWKREGASSLATSKARNKAYAWLARQLGLRFNDCHIGRFDAETCQRVIDLCAEERRKAA